MENENRSNKRELPMQSGQNSNDNAGGFNVKELTLYDDDVVDVVCIRDNIKKLKIAFPDLSMDWFELLADMIREKKFTKNQLNDAVKHCICNFTAGKTPHIANIISFDRTIKSHTYHEMLAIAHEEAIKTSDFIAIDTGEDKPKWIKKTTYNKHKNKFMLWKRQNKE